MPSRSSFRSVAAVLRLALFPFGYGIVGAFVGGTLNRVMIAERGFPASLVGLFFAMPLLESPLRVWLGHRSDTHPLLGLRREPYVVLGSLVAGAGLLATALFTGHGGGGVLPLLASGSLAFLVYGLGRNLAHSVFQALLADLFKGKTRGAAAAGYEVASVLGLILGSGLIGRALESYDPGRLVLVAGALAAGFPLLATLGVFAQEARGEAATEAALRAGQSSFREVLGRLIASDPQVRRFFSVVLLTVLGTMAQDVLLEPYGGLVLGMSVGATTRLTMFWGLGVMLSMVVSGAVLIPWLGHLRVLRLGLVASVAVFVGVVLCGVSGRGDLFRLLVGLMGLSTGLAGAGVLTGSLHFTTPERAGLLMGVWGMANLLGKALGGLLGGGVVDLVRAWGGTPLGAYGAVFAMEGVLLAVALALTGGLALGLAPDPAHRRPSET